MSIRFGTRNFNPFTKINVLKEPKEKKISEIKPKIIHVSPKLESEFSNFISFLFSKFNVLTLFFADKKNNSSFQNCILPNLPDNQVYFFDETNKDLDLGSIPKCEMMFVDSINNLNLILREVVMKCKGIIVLNLENMYENKDFFDFRQANVEKVFYLKNNLGLIDHRQPLNFDYTSSEIFSLDFLPETITLQKILNYL